MGPQLERQLCAIPPAAYTRGGTQAKVTTMPPTVSRMDVTSQI